MKRWALCLAAAVFFNFIAASVFHVHPAKARGAEPCQLCALGGQADRHAPTQAPEAQKAETVAVSSRSPRLVLISRFQQDPSSRAPPAV